MSRYYPPVTVTGNPVNFSAPNGGKLDSVSVQIIPTQDLHGYSNPWPAGGGVNKIGIPDGVDFTLKGVRYYTDAGNLYLDGTSTGETSSASAAFKTNFSFTLQPGYYYFSRMSYNRPVYLLSDSGTLATNSGTFTIAEPTVVWVGFYIYNAVFNNEQCPIIATLSSAPTEYSPFSNICPISGLTGLSVYVSPTQDPDDATVYNVDWSTQAGTVYHGTVDVVSGELTVDMVNIPSYNGETITEPWLSSMDAYAAGTTPTIGAQVVYTLADPAVYQLGLNFLTVLSGENYVWASNNETISVVYALLVPGSEKYTLVVNGADIADFVERDSYRTTLYPVFSEAVQTLDGVGHTALLRKKGELSARFNPRTAADTAIICAALLNAPCEVQYHCLQRNADVTALMTIDSVSALYLSRCLYCGQKWNDIDSITLTEL